MQTAKIKVIDFLHGQLVEPVKVARKRKINIIWILLSIFLIVSISISLSYYFLYIHGQNMRIDLDFQDKDAYLDDGKEINCDCALPIIINPLLITSSSDFKQPKFTNCLKKDLVGFFHPLLLNSTVGVLSYNFLAVPLNSEIGVAKQHFSNIIISKERPLMTKLGNITLLRYMSEVYGSFMNYIAIYTVNLLESSSWLTYQMNTTAHPDAIDDIIMQYELSDRKHNILTAILNCFNAIDFEHYTPDDFLMGLSENDCLPVNCYFFDKYTPFQGIVLIITFYLAVIGYVIFILQCTYQKLTTEESIGDKATNIEAVANIVADANEEVADIEAVAIETVAIETDAIETVAIETDADVTKDDIELQNTAVNH